MLDLITLRKAWALLDARERRSALKVLAVAALSAFAAMAMVGSIMPFLSVLSEPARITDTPQLAWAYERFGFASPYGFLIALGLVALMVIILATAILLLKIYVTARFAMMRVHSISHRLLARYLCQPYEYFLDHHSGEMGTNVLAEAQEVVYRFLIPMTELITAMLTVAALVGFLLWVEPFVALATFGVFGGVYVGAYTLSRIKLRRLGKTRVVANAERYRLATEALGGVKAIKLLGREHAYVDRFSGPSHRMADAETRGQVLMQIPKHIIQGGAFGGVIILCLALLEPKAFADGSELGTILPILGVFVFAGQRMMPELGKLYQAAAKIQTGKSALDIVYADLIDQPTALTSHIPCALGLRESLQLEGVSYRYPKADHAGVTNITLTIQAGETIGVVGGTGAGKTTLADIILGLLRPHAGLLIADGTPISETNLRAWQQSVGYVPQDIFLTDASVSENIALGIAPEEIDLARVTRAARTASIDRFIREELPDSYDTTVGERGVRLSGGQRQRIGIARALYHDADLIVFDEATSALDNLTEQEVIKAIDALPGDKTVVMIAHRLTTVKRCDRIVMMENGRVAGYGSWEALIQDNPSFQRLAKLSKTA